MARPHFADVGTTTDKEGKCEYGELAVAKFCSRVVLSLRFERRANNESMLKHIFLVYINRQASYLG